MKIECSFDLEQPTDRSNRPLSIEFDRANDKLSFPGGPERPGVYVFEIRGPLEPIGDPDVLLAVYVGETGNLAQRMAKYQTAANGSAGNGTERRVVDDLRELFREGATATVYWVRSAHTLVDGEEPAYPATHMHQHSTRLLVENALLHWYREHRLAFNILNRERQASLRIMRRELGAVLATLDSDADPLHIESGDELISIVTTTEQIKVDTM